MSLCESPLEDLALEFLHISISESKKKKNYRLEDLEIFLDFFVLILGINGGNCLIFIDLFYEHSVGLGHAHGNS